MMFFLGVLRQSMIARLLAATAAAFVAIKGFAYYERGVGKEQLRQQAKQAGMRANVKNEAVRRAAREPGAAERVRERFCRDCSQ